LSEVKKGEKMKVVKKNKIIIGIVILIFIVTINIYPMINKNNSNSKEENTIKIYSEEQSGPPRMLQATIDEFKREYPNIKVEKVVFNDAQKYNQKLLSDTLSGGGPDVLYFDTQHVNATILQKSGVLTDVKPLIDKDNSFKKADYNFKVINSGIYKDKLTLIPIDYYINGYLSTKQLMDKNNIKLWDNISESDFVNTISSKLSNTNSGKTLFAYPIKITDFIASSGIDFIDYENKKVYFSKKEFKKIIDNYKKIYKLTPKSSDFTGYSGEEGMAALKNGTTLFSDDEAVLSYPLALLNSESQIKATTGEDIVLNTIPTYSGNNDPIAIVKECMGINSKSKNKQAAYNFIKIALSQKSQQDINFIPVNRITAKYIENNYLNQFNGKKSIFVSDGNSSSGVTLIRPSTDIEKYYDNITGNIKEAKITDPTMDNLMMECLSGYFEDKQSYESALVVLENKVKLYINE
jgi:multiple sugar transport system substrate-binding protein